jgi:exonuclease SbcC
VDEDACELRRQWNPNKLEYLSPEGELYPINQEQIIEWLGLTEEEARHCLLIGQHESMFFDMKPMEKQNLFTDVLLLETWTALSKEASDKAASIEQEIRVVQGTVDENETKAGMLREQAEQHLQKAEEAEEERLGRLEAIDDVLEEMRGTYQTLKADAADLGKRKKKLPKTDKLQAELEKAASVQAEIEQDLSSANKELQGVSRDITKAESSLKKMETLSGDCTRCGQEISAAHKKKEIKAINQEIKALETEKDELLTAVEELQEELAAQEEIWWKRADKISKSREEASDIERTSLRLENDRDILAGQIASKEQAAAELEELDNVFDELAKQSLETADSLDREASLLQRKVTSLEAKCSNYNFWVNGYKEIRLSVVETALDQLEIETNNYLAKFGLSDWYVFFDTEKENKSGTTTKGFTVSIQSPEVDKPVPWEAWSGGETQRLKLSGTLGLMSLLLNRRGLSTSLLMLDEPTTHLGGSGVPDLLDLLADFAEDEAKTVWFIDHRTEEYGIFDGNLHVTKDSKGSKVTLDV